MFDIKVTVACPDVLKAVDRIAEMIRNGAACAKSVPAPMPVQPTIAAPTPVPAPVEAAPTPAAAPVTVTAAPVAAAPVAAAPSYTVAQVAKAGADLMSGNPALQPALVDLIHRFGAQTVQEIPHDKLGAFATELRQMGAKI